MPQPTLLFSTLPRLTLPENCRQSWMREALELRYPDPRGRGAWRRFAAASARLAQAHLPAEVIEEVKEFFSPEGPDAMVIENLPVDPDLPRTPADGRRPAQKTAVSEAVLAGVIESYANIFAYSNEKSGAPIQEIAPVAGKEETPSNAGRVPFPCHTDVAFLAPEFSPEGLALIGLRNPNGAATTIVPLEMILASAPRFLIDSLSKPIFHHAAPSSFELAASVTAPILWRDRAGKARIRVQTHSVKPADDEARGALAALRGLLAALEPHRVTLGAGIAVLFKNDRVLHARDAVSGDRWLQRAYFTSSLDRFRYRTGSAANEFIFDAWELLRMAGQASTRPQDFSRVNAFPPSF